VQLGSSPARIAKTLKALRRKAGKVRDFDVHLGLLKSSRLSLPAADKLREVLKEKRARQLGKLRSSVDEAAPLLEAHLPALVESHLKVATVSPDDARQRASRARRRFLRWTRDIPVDEQRLHQLRIRIKKLRYSLEPLETCKEAVALVAKFKQVQDAIGRWHDWATLEQLAGRYLDASDGETSDAALACQALHARTVREYRKARRTAQNVRSGMNGPRPLAPAAATHASSKLIRKAG
jgi:CHAD domain-containing protein